MACSGSRERLDPTGKDRIGIVAFKVLPFMTLVREKERKKEREKERERETGRKEDKGEKEKYKREGKKENK